MDDIVLLASTGAGPVDTIVHAVLARFEATFPQRVHSSYVIGSYADQTRLPTSDIDLAIVVAGQAEAG